jgi:hypothetical protein
LLLVLLRSSSHDIVGYLLTAKVSLCTAEPALHKKPKSLNLIDISRERERETLSNRAIEVPVSL